MINRFSVNSKLKSILNNLIPFLPLLLLWQYLFTMKIVPPSFLPSPLAIPKAFVQLIFDDNLGAQVGVTLYRVLFAAIFGLVIGIASGILISTSKFLYKITRDLIDFLQAVGEIGWLPLLVIWSGFNDRTIMIAIGYTIFFPIFYGTISGFQQIPKNLIDSIRTLGGNKKDIILHVMLPGALPSIITGFRTGVGFGWRTVILAEMLIAQSGLGVTLFYARQFFRVDWVFVGMILSGLIWLTMDNVLLKPLEARTIQRWGIKKAI